MDANAANNRRAAAPAMAGNAAVGRSARQFPSLYHLRGNQGTRLAARPASYVPEAAEQALLIVRPLVTISRFRPLLEKICQIGRLKATKNA
jgi:hypothetical protein